MATTKRPTTCHGMFVADPTLGAEGCKRLPRHGGDHRATLTARQSRVATTKVVKGKASVKAILTALAVDVEAGKISAGDALAQAAALLSPKAAPRVTKAAPKSIVKGTKVTTKSGLAGIVTRVTKDSATVRLALSGQRRVYLINTLRIAR